MAAQVDTDKGGVVADGVSQDCRIDQQMEHSLSWRCLVASPQTRQCRVMGIDYSTMTRCLVDELAVVELGLVGH